MHDLADSPGRTVTAPKHFVTLLILGGREPRLGLRIGAPSVRDVHLGALQDAEDPASGATDLSMDHGLDGVPTAQVERYLAVGADGSVLHAPS